MAITCEFFFSVFCLCCFLLLWLFFVALITLLLMMTMRFVVIGVGLYSRVWYFGLYMLLVRCAVSFWCCVVTFFIKDHDRNIRVGEHR